MSVITKTIAHAATVGLTSTLIRPWFGQRPDRTYRRARWIRSVLGERALCAVASHLAAVAMCGRMFPAAGQIVSIDPRTQEVTEVDTDAAPPMVRAMLRFTLATGNGDSAGAWAVWLSVPRGQRLGLVMAMVGAAAEHLKTHLDELDDDHTDVPDDARDLTEPTS